MEKWISPISPTGSSQELNTHTHTLSSLDPDGKITCVARWVARVEFHQLRGKGTPTCRLKKSYCVEDVPVFSKPTKALWAKIWLIQSWVFKAKEKQFGQTIWVHRKLESSEGDFS